MTTWVLLAVLWAGSAHERVEIVRGGLAEAECRHLMALFSVGAIVARYRCEPEEVVG